MNINKEDNDWYPLLLAIDDINIEIVRLLIDYANKNDIILKLNEKTSSGWYPLLLAISKIEYFLNIKMVELLMDYANKKNIILEINEKK